MTYRLLAQHQVLTGTSPAGNLQKAFEHFRKTLEIKPNHISAYLNEGSAFTLLAEYQLTQGLNPADSVNNAVESLNKNMEIAGENPYALFNMSYAYTLAAEHDYFTGKDPSQNLKTAKSILEKGLAESPDPSAYLLLTETWIVDARNKMAQLQSPDIAFAEANKALKLSDDSAPRFNYYKGALKLLEAQWERRSSLQSLSEARDEFTKAVARNNNDVMSRVHLAWTIAVLSKNRNEIDEAVKIIDRVLAETDQLPIAAAVKGILFIAESKLSDAENPPEKELQGRQLLDDAYKRNPFLRRMISPP